MSVTAADLLRLPSLRQATVIGGHRGLTKIVSSVSVLESIDPENLTEGMFGTGEYIGSEIVITGFINCANDVECQCANIRRLAEGGEVGLILFYVGIFIPEVDERLIKLADELDFVLIQMPAVRNLRYSEVINDVMNYIFNDREKNESIVTDVLARMSVLPKQKRTVNTVLRMISDRVLASIILTNESFEVLNQLAWPQGIEEQLPLQPKELRRYAEFEEVQEFAGIKNSRIYPFYFYADGGVQMHLFVVKEGEILSQMVQEQIVDIVRICMNIWGKGHGTIAVRELIRAILQDDPIKMRRLSDIFHIDVESIHEMWIVRGDELPKKMETICANLKTHAKTVIADIYEQQLILFTSTLHSEKTANEIIGEMLKEEVSLSRCSALQTTKDVRRAYLCHQKYFENAKKIYPERKCLSFGDLEYTKMCCELIEQGEDAISRHKEYLKELQASSTEWDAVKTLAVYLLDADGSVTRTAENLYLHKNTVKYRLKMIADTFGFKPDKMPESMYLYQALAIYRLMN